MNKYETRVMDLDNGNSFSEGWEYKENEKLWNVIASLVHSGRRVRIWYGDETGRSWNKEYNITGIIGRSKGKSPILINNSRCSGGVALLDDCIIRIDDIKDKRTLYKHENFHVEKMEVEIESGSEYPYRVMQHKDSGEVQNIASFKDNKRALRWIDFMNGNRYCK